MRDNFRTSQGADEETHRHAFAISARPVDIRHRPCLAIIIQHHPTLGKSADGFVGYDSSDVAIYRSRPGMKEGLSVAHKPPPFNQGSVARQEL
jgi:hypothetical protein